MQINLNKPVRKPTTSQLMSSSNQSKSSLKSDIKWKFSKINRTYSNQQNSESQMEVSKTVQNSFTLAPYFQIKSNSIEVPVRYHHSSLIIEGSMYVYGGYQNQTGILNDFLVFKAGLQQENWRDGKWEKIEHFCEDEKNYPGPRHSHSAVFHNKEIIIFGGKINMFQSTNTIHEFSLLTKQWRLINPLNPESGPKNIDSHQAIIYENTMLVFGGFEGNQYSNKMYALNLDNYQWFTLFEPSLTDQIGTDYPEPRADFTMNLDNNLLYIYAGHCSNKTYKDLWQFDLKEKRVKKLTNGTRRSGHSSIIYNNNLIVYGGITGVTHERNDLMVYNIQNDQWVIYWQNSEDRVQVYEESTLKNQLGLKKRGSLYKTRQAQKYQLNDKSMTDSREKVEKLGKYRRTLKQQKQQRMILSDNKFNQNNEKKSNRNNALLNQLSSSSVVQPQIQKPEDMESGKSTLKNGMQMYYSPLMESLSNSIVVTSNANNNKYGTIKERDQVCNTFHSKQNQNSNPTRKIDDDARKQRLGSSNLSPVLIDKNQQGNFKRISARDGHTAHLLTFTDKDASQANPKNDQTPQKSNKTLQNFYLVVFAGNRHMISYNDLTFICLKNLLETQ